MTKKFDDLANSIIENVGGKENVTFLTHCVTRLRFNIKDESKVRKEEINSLRGVLGSQFSAGQYQVVIGKDVRNVYEVICSKMGISPEQGLDELLDEKEKQPFTIKRMFNSIMDALTSCLVALLPVVIASGMIKMLYTLIGPTMLNVVPDTSDLYKLLVFVGDAGYYFLPIFCGYTASKKFKTNPLISMMLGAILLHPTLLAIMQSGEAFTVYGIPMTVASYSSTVIPMVLIVWIQSYVERGLNRVIPEIVKMAFVPVLTILVMLPLALGVLGPLGTIIGTVMSSIVLGINNVFGPLAVALIAGLWLILVTTGMHTTLRTVTITQLFQVGFDNIMLPAVMASSFATVAVGLAYTLRVKDKEKKSLGISCAISQAIAGASEPTLFGILMPQKKIWGCLIVGAFSGGLYMGLTQVACYIMAPSVYLAPLSFGGPAGNIVNGLIGCGIAFIVTFAMVYFVGFKNKKEA